MVSFIDRSWIAKRRMAKHAHPSSRPACPPPPGWQRSAQAPTVTRQGVFFTGRDGKLAAATSGPSGGAWTVSELPGTPAPATSLLAANYLLPSGALAADVFYQTASGQPAATSLTANTQQATILPGTATAILGASAYPAPGQPQRLFLANGTRITVDSAGMAGGPWTATKLPGAAANVP